MWGDDDATGLANKLSMALTFLMTVLCTSTSSS
jgi:hypothetical protein